MAPATWINVRFGVHFADTSQTFRKVRGVEFSDQARRSKARLLDHLVSKREKCRAKLREQRPAIADSAVLLKRAIGLPSRN